MSKFTEILKMIPKGISNPQDIIDGWVNDAKLENGDLSDEQTELILKRRAICEACPFNSSNARTSLEYKELYGKNYTTSLNSLHCAICSCNVKKKSACLHCSCGLSEYNLNNPTNKQELKW